MSFKVLNLLKKLKLTKPYLILPTISVRNTVAKPDFHQQRCLFNTETPVIPQFTYVFTQRSLVAEMTYPALKAAAHCSFKYLFYFWGLFVFVMCFDPHEQCGSRQMKKKKNLLCKSHFMAMLFKTTELLIYILQ